MSVIAYAHPAGELVFADAASGAPPAVRWTSFRERPRARRRREFSYPGADGVEELRLGAGAQELELEGYLIAGSESELAALKAALRAANDGRAGTLSVRGAAERFAEVVLAELSFGEHAVGQYYLESFRILWRSLRPGD
jgi:hypothetical protein